MFKPSRIYIYLTIAVNASVLVFLFLCYNNSAALYNNLILSLFVLGSVFFVSFVALELLVFKGIRKIYLRVHASRLQNKNKPELPDSSFTGDVINNLHNEVIGWAEERKNEVEQLKRLETYRKEFLGNVSHELKTPIFTIQGYVLTLLDGGLEDPKINREYLQRAEKSVDRMIRIVEDLEAISHLETGELEIDTETFDLVPIVKDIFESQEMRATEKGIIMTFKDPEEKPVYVSADRFRIRQVFTNLIVNSIKYGKEYGETKVKFYDSGDTITVEVADNGIGISEEHLPRLFERFYRVDKGRSRDQGGTGLGLAIVKHIIEAHGQTITVMSTVGVGSVFSFTLKKGAISS